MKIRNSIPLLAWLVFALVSAYSAQSGSAAPGQPSLQSTGTVSGRVQNVLTGRYLKNARIAVTGTNLLAITDEDGGYQLTNVPGGTISLEVTYTGLDPQRVAVTVPAGQGIRQDIGLTSVARYGVQDGTVWLDPFTVASTRETDGAMIAINEQRNAPNLKSVVSVDAYGDVVGGNNMADFLKYIPGIQLQGGPTFESESVFVRGFPSNLAVVTSDGAPMAATDGNRDQRRFSLNGVSINNYSRVEVTKVPTPATAADTMAGSINLVTKNAFERDRTEFRYRVDLTGNSRYVTLQKTPFRNETYTYKINPGFTVDYHLPVNKRFGLIVTAAHSNMFFPQDYITRDFQTSGAGTGASVSKPYMMSHQFRDTKRHNLKDSVSLKADWRLTPHSVLSADFVTNYSVRIFGDAAVTFATGTNGTPTVAGGVPFSYGENFTVGATGRGSVTYGGVNGTSEQNLATNVGNIRYTFDNGGWKIDLAASKSSARLWQHTTTNDAFGLLTATTKVPVRVTFTDIGLKGPGRIQVFNNANQEIDAYDPNNFNLTGITGIEQNRRDDIETVNLDLKRRLNFLPFPTSVQVGGVRRIQERDKSNVDPRWTYQGINGDLSSKPFLAKVYGNEKFAFDPSGRVVPHLSSQVAWQAWKANPALFVSTPVQLVTAERARITASEFIQETVDAAYAQTEMRLFKNRLYLLTGIRYEKTTDQGQGLLQDQSAVWQRNANGSFAHNAAGALIRRPEAGAVGSIEEARLIYQERKYRGTRSYDGFYPSLHLNYNLRENFLARAAYARTYGRPNFRDIIPNAITNENDVDDNVTSAVLGTITVRNTGLLPWTADNYDLSLEYYTDKGGVIGVNYFYKNIRDFFGSLARIATAADVELLGLDPRFIGWQVNSTINSGDASISGTELSMSHSLDALGRWGQYFRVFANATKLKLKGNQAANFAGFVPESANAGVTFSKRPFIFMAKLNYRGEERVGTFATYGPNGSRYNPKQKRFDVSIDYHLRPNLSIFLNARNVFNDLGSLHQTSPETPNYAIEYQNVDYGVPFSLGIKGSF